MNNENTHREVPLVGAPAPATRLFGWGMLSVLTAFMISNVLVIGWEFRGLGELAEWNADSMAIAAIYAILILLSSYWVLRTPHRSLRQDARIISDFNAWLIRGCFFAVLFTGIADSIIAFLRVEGLLDNIFSDQIARDMTRSHFIGPWIHFPLMVAGFSAALFSRTLGFCWLALLIVAAELLIVFSRFVFSYEQALMGDLVRYWYAALFLFSSAYTLMEEGHVRVDVFYAGFKNSVKGRINAIGTILLGMTTSWTIILIGMGSKQAIVNSPVFNFEVSQSGTAGMFIKYQMAAFLAIFAITMLIQFISYLFEAVADMRSEPGKREFAAISH
ncbi:MAG: TRAP transporter small permease subunit [Roseovarius sp.]|nr:TRAP transporter small permease subunit [Roseovarius sp.]